MDTLDMANAYANHPFDDEELAREKADEKLMVKNILLIDEYKELLRDESSFQITEQSMFQSEEMVK